MAAKTAAESGLIVVLLEKRQKIGEPIRCAEGVSHRSELNNTTSNGIMLVGDAAHQSDPLTGGGIINAMRAGVMAEEMAGKAVSSEDVSIAALKEYEDRWRSSIGKQIKKRYRAKNFFLKLTDNDPNRLIGSLHGKDISQMNTRDLLSALYKQNPKLLWNLGILNPIDQL
jgi:digeranylgeranylglycerophospholipid reductase